MLARAVEHKDAAFAKPAKQVNAKLLIVEEQKNEAQPIVKEHKQVVFSANFQQEINGSDENEIPLEESVTNMARQSKNPQVKKQTAGDLPVTPRLTPETEMKRSNFYTATKLQKLPGQSSRDKKSDSSVATKGLGPAQNKGQQKEMEAKLCKQWTIRGIVNFGFNEANLELVVEKMTKIGRVPEGYLYADLHELKETPDELQ